MTIKALALSVSLLVVTCTVGCAGARRDSAALLGDQDADNPAGSYHDGDDGSVVDYGHAASATDSRAVTALVERYYSAAVAENGTLACSLTYYLEAETLPEEYGQPPGPRWLHGASTCPAVLLLVFKHFHRALTAPVRVTSVRVEGERAQALVGFGTLPAGVVKVRREAGAWKVDGLLAVALP